MNEKDKVILEDEDIIKKTETKLKKTKTKAKAKPKKAKAKPVIKKFDKNEYVTVFGYFNGSLNLKVQNENDTYVFEGFLDEQQVRYGVLQALARRRDKVLSIPRIYIADEEVVKALRLDRMYKDLLNPIELEVIFKKSVEEIVDIIDKADRNMKSIITDLAISKIKDKTLENYTVIKILSEKLNFHLESEM